MTNTNSKEESVTSISALLRKRKRELTRLEGSIGEKKNAADRLRVTIKNLESSLKKANEDRKRKGFVSLAGKWYLSETNSNKVYKEYFFIKEDLGYFSAPGWSTVYRKLLIDKLSIEKTAVVDGTRTTQIVFDAHKGYSYFADTKGLKPVKPEEIEEEVRQQYLRFANRTENHGLNLYWDFTRKVK